MFLTQQQLYLKGEFAFYFRLQLKYEWSACVDAYTR
jgi:hypothetical protein